MPRVIFSKYYPKHQKIVRVRMYLDYLVYGSSAIDAVIMFITLLSFWRMPTALFLEEAAMLLTIVVVLTIILGGTLLFLQYFDSIMKHAFAFVDAVQSLHRKIVCRPRAYNFRRALMTAAVRRSISMFIGVFIAALLIIRTKKRRE